MMRLGNKFVFNIASIVGKVFYISLLIAGFLFSKDAITQYREGKTATEVKKQPISLDDLPTITICYNKLKFLEENCNSDIMREFDNIYYREWWSNTTLFKFSRKKSSQVCNTSINTREGEEKIRLLTNSDGAQWAKSSHFGFI